MILGEVGSGKSSLLHAILNNMLIKDDDKLEKTKIAVNGSISYVAQTAWIQNDTVKNNILFFNDFDPVKYDKIIKLCELNQDLESLIGGDQTEIGEKGINLSGGQKARISLARAVYADKDIYLLDDPLSALDAHVGEKIMVNCISEHLKGKTRILVTHAVHFFDKADKIIIMKNGEIKWMGDYQSFQKESFFQEYVKVLQLSTEQKKDDDEIEEVLNSTEIKHKLKNKT